MKKLLWISFSIVLFLSGISHIKAATSLKATSSTNGNVALQLDFEEGYVGAIDLTLTLSSNMTVTNVNWNTSLSSSYTKRYTYDEANHTVRIYLATGSNTKNLVDKDGILSIGTLVVKSVSGKSADYKVQIKSLSIVDANYTSITKNDLAISGNNQFTYQVNNSFEEDSNPPTGNNASNNNSQGSSSNQTTNKPNSNNQEQNVDEINKEDETDDNSSDITDDNNSTGEEEKKPEVDNTQPDDLKVSEAKQGLSWKIIFGIVVITMLLITLISMVTKKFKD